MGRVEKEKLVQELSDCADLSVKQENKINEFFSNNYIINEKKRKVIPFIKELWKKDNVNYYLEHEKKGHFDFIDVSKAIAMIFIYMGHWISLNITSFAYSFHLFLFFMVSGFFALHMQRDSFFGVIKKLFKRLFIPILLWACIAFVITHLDGMLDLRTVPDILFYTGAVMPNYWFIPSLFSTALIYWILAKSLKKPWLIVLITFVLNICFGETGFVRVLSLDIFMKIPFGAWFNISAFLTYGFWYALGVAVFPLLLKFIYSLDSTVKKHRYLSRTFAYFCIFVSATFLLHKSFFKIFGINSAVYAIFVIARGLVIIISMFVISYLLQESKYLNKIGKHTLVFVGMEFIIHDFISITLMQSLNLGFFNFINPVSVITYNLVIVWMVSKVADICDRYFPILNGKQKK